MRIAGRISEWNDEKGFGFVMPNGGGDRAFMHISEFPRSARRPVTGDLVSYVPRKDSRGRPQACEVRHAGQQAAPPRSPSPIPRAAMGVSALLAVLIAAGVKAIPLAVAGLYVFASVIAYLLYFFDKRAAKRGGQRTPESSLQMAALLGGWPGALIAQQQFRHKTIKQSFQTVFWLVVVTNLVGIGWLVASGRAAALARALG